MGGATFADTDKVEVVTTERWSTPTADKTPVAKLSCVLMRSREAWAISLSFSIRVGCFQLCLPCHRGFSVKLLMKIKQLLACRLGFCGDPAEDDFVVGGRLAL